MKSDQADIADKLLKIDWSFPSQSGGKGIFGLHPYPAKFIPQIPRALIHALNIPKNSVVFDPFCGSGTTLIEAQSLGFKTIGVDLNPIACLISRVATTPQPEKLSDKIKKCLQIARNSKPKKVTHIPNLDHWFKKPIQDSISSILIAIEKESCKHTREVLNLALSSTLVRVSNQDSDTRYAAIKKKHTAEDVFKLFQKVCVKYVDDLPNPDCNYPKSKVICDSILDITKKTINEKVGLVICSPPYPNAYEYWLYHKYRMWWLGYDPLYVKEREIGARPHYFKKNPMSPEDFQDQMEIVFSLLNKVCVKDAYACFVIGDSKIHGEIIDNTALLINAAKEQGFQMITVLDRNISLSRKSFNLSNSRLKKENIVIFKKDKKIKHVQLSWHEYKYYPYEKEFAYKEITALSGFCEISQKNEKTLSIKLSGIYENELYNLVYFSSYQIGTNPPKLTLQAKLESTSKRKQSTRYSIHGLHEYKGKFNPQVVRSILNGFSINTKCKVLDPFCGSGTTLVEASIAGIQSTGWDINPFAVYLSNAKLAALYFDIKDINNVADKIISSFISKKTSILPRESTYTNYLKKWFPQDTFETIETLRTIITREAGGLKPYFLLILSNLLRDYSLQEPSDLRIRRRKSAMPTVALIDKLKTEFSKEIKKLQIGIKIHGKVNISSHAITIDNREPIRISAGSTKFDFALTSPPYATALPYIDTQRLSLVWLELLTPELLKNTEQSLIGSREALKTELNLLNEGLDNNVAELPKELINYCKTLKSHLSNKDGFRRQAVPALLYRYFSDMLKSFNSVRNAIKPNGIYCLVVGTNRTTLSGTEFNIDTPYFLSQLAKKAGWSIVELQTLNTYKRYGLHAINAVKGETLVILKNE